MGNSRPSRPPTTEVIATQSADGLEGRIRPWHRLAARCRAARLDRELAGGASPEASASLAARAMRSAARPAAMIWSPSSNERRGHWPSNRDARRNALADNDFNKIPLELGGAALFGPAPAPPARITVVKPERLRDSPSRRAASATVPPGGNHAFYHRQQREDHGGKHWHEREISSRPVPNASWLLPGRSARGWRVP
jgi:hypothetical protein